MSDYPNKRDCKHGSMRGKCDICEYEQDIKELEAKVAELEKNLNISECLSEERREFIINGVELGYISIPDDKIDPAYFTFWRCQLENSYAFDSMKLEQQAKALEELLTYPNHRFHGDSRLYYSEYSINRAIENLRKQTKGGDV